jgi:DNA recombination protein RmuC
MDIIIICLLVVNLIGLAFLWLKSKDQDRLERVLREEIVRNRSEISQSTSSFQDSLFQRLNESTGFQKNQLDSFIKQLGQLTQMNEQKLEKVREAVDSNLRSLQQDNSAKLDKMREIVDEKLQSTLEKRLGESFKMVSDRLEKVHQGLGEMQTLAVGVGDLKKVLTNVKTRGIWGEIQLGNLLEQILTPEQYSCNVATKKGSRDLVEFAVKLPGRNNETVFIPIDAKFPKDDYERLIHAQEAADKVQVDESFKALENRIKLEAKKIKEKYIDPPFTTDFAVLYIPIEGLYAEILRMPAVCEFIQREYRVIIAGPTNISAFLNSLQMGFRTLAVEKRASEVWSLLGVVKTEFGKFGDILKKTQERLRQASDEINLAEQKSRTIEQKLKKVQDLPTAIEPVELVKEIDVTPSSSKDEVLF